MPSSYDPERHHRRSIRLKAFDYRTPGAYVVTICTQNRACLFGKIVNGQMNLSPSGRMAQMVWDEIPGNYSGVEIDAFIVMPNHIHGIVALLPDDIDPDSDAWLGPRHVGASPRGCPSPGETIGADGHDRRDPERGYPQGGAPTGGLSRPSPGDDRRLSLPDVVHRFKSLTTKRYGDGVRDEGWPPYDGRLWQRNYFEHVIRHERELNQFREYIEINPARWDDDRHNPSKINVE